MRIRSLMAATALALAAAATAVPAGAAELVTNGGFESGALSGWTMSGNSAFSSVTNAVAHSGQFSYSSGATGTDNFISQTVATVAGQSYDFSFWLQNQGGPANDFTASLGGAVLTSLVNSSSFGFTQFTGSVVAASDNATLTFAFRQDPSFWQLDDVSLAGSLGGVPEPATWGLMLTGFLGAGVAIRSNRRRQAALAA